MTWFPRLLGAATTAYGAAIALRPALLAAPCGLTDTDGRTPGEVAVLCRGIGTRDVVSGLAMTMARDTPALRQAIAVRVASDAGDAALFGTLLPDSRARSKAACVAGGWAALCALSALTVRSSGRPRR